MTQPFLDPGHVQPKGDKVGKDCQQVDPVHQVLTEFRLVWRGEQASEELDGEVGHVANLDDDEGCELSGNLVLVVLEVGKVVESEKQGGEGNAGGR